MFRRGQGDSNVLLALAFSDHRHLAQATWTDGWLAVCAVGHGAQSVRLDEGLGRFAGLDFVGIGEPQPGQGKI
jgi:hypothetical protein